MWGSGQMSAGTGFVETVVMHGIRIASTGGPEVLEWAELPDPEPGLGEVLVEVAAAGVNFIDTYQRSGLYPMPLPYVPGLEGAGTVVAIGPPLDPGAAGTAGGSSTGNGNERLGASGATEAGAWNSGPAITVGQRVAWLDGLGSYAQRVVLPASRVVPVPDGVGLDVAAAVMLQGATAQYLVTDTYRLAAGEVCLVQAAAGGVGLLLTQLAERAGATVVAVVGSAAKAELASAAGADHVVQSGDGDLVAAVEAVVGPKALHVVYDGVGKATFMAGLDLLRPRGMMVTFGNASGPVDPISPLLLSQKGSLFLTRPTLAHYTVTTEELRYRVGAMFGLMASGALDVRIGLRVPLAEAPRAHQLLESRQTTGKVLLEP